MWKSKAEELYKNGMGVRAISRELGVNYSTVQYHLKKQPVVKDSPTIFVIPDTQVKHGVDLSYIHWIGAYIKRKKPDIVIQIGDWYDMEALSSYDKGKKRAEGKRFINDINAGNKALDILDSYLDYKPRKIITLGNHECLVPETEVMTKDGFKPIHMVTECDTVAQMGESGTLVWGKPKSVVKKHYSDDLVVYDNQSFQFAGTKNHRMYYLSCNDNLNVAEAINMSNNFKIITGLNNTNDDYDISDDLLKLSAWACTDSHFDKYGSLILYQRLSNAHKIRDLLESLGVRYKEKVRDRNITEICGKVLKKRPEPSCEFYLQENPTEVTNNKRLPGFAEKLSKRQWEIFLEVLIDADGSIPTKSKASRVFYGAKQICDDVQFYAVQNGWTASLTEYRPNQWRVNLVERTSRRQENIKKNLVPYDGEVYCLEMPLENFVIRYKNRVHVTGNCRIDRYVEENPEFDGLIGTEQLAFAKKGWEVYPFLKPVCVEGIYFVHYLANPMSGKPLGGTALSRLNKFGDSYVMGHQQTLDIAYRDLPLSGKKQVGIIAGACYDHMEDYKGHQGNYHFRGAVMLYECKDGSAWAKPISLEHMQKSYCIHK